jgi:isochorismate synthase EntC
MAGTVALGQSDGADGRELARLRASAKDLAEHAVVVDAVRSSLEPLCTEVFARADPDVVKLSTVAHLATTVGGWLDCPAPSALAVAARLHPTPAVAGCPVDAALAAIADLEGFHRGQYAGPVGWVDARGDGEWAVALRCASLNGATATLSAGAGIVAGSDPDREWDETEAKLRAMLDALGATG